MVTILYLLIYYNIINIFVKSLHTYVIFKKYIYFLIFSAYYTLLVMQSLMTFYFRTRFEQLKYMIIIDLQQTKLFL